MNRKFSDFQLLLDSIKPYPVRLVLTLILGFSSAIFSGVSTTLIVPVILTFLGQDMQFQDGPPVIRALLKPFEGFSEEYRLFLMAGAIILRSPSRMPPAI